MSTKKPPKKPPPDWLRSEPLPVQNLTAAGSTGTSEQPRREVVVPKCPFCGHPMRLMPSSGPLLQSWSCKPCVGKERSFVSLARVIES
jgi:hypothetical protein